MLNRHAMSRMINDEIDRYCGIKRKPGGIAPCFGCGKPIKLDHPNRIYCDTKCGRRAHYMRFRVRARRPKLARRAAA